MALAQSERGVKMPRIKNHQSVIVCCQFLFDSFLLCSGAGARKRQGRAFPQVVGTMLTPRGAGAKNRHETAYSF
jgi:hypothetical protein